MNNLTLKNWETLEEIRLRTRLNPEYVIAHVRLHHAAGQIICRFVKRDGIERVEWRHRDDD